MPDASTCRLRAALLIAGACLGAVGCATTEGSRSPPLPTEPSAQTSAPPPAASPQPAQPPAPETPAPPAAALQDLPIPDPILTQAADADLWERLRRGFRIPDLNSPLVAAHERWYASRPDYVQRTVERAGPWLFHIVEELERRNMPTEVALIPFIESAFNPQAMSSAQASGMWQFIPGTGKHYGLNQTMFRDERRDPLESTRAALDYFEKLHTMFGDWQLAFAAYNCGEGAVMRAIEKNRRKGKRTDYASLTLPKETRNYVPKLQAVKNIVLDPGHYALTLPAIENERYFVTVMRTRDIDVSRAAEFAGMTQDEFLALNPSFNKPVIIGAMQPQIVLPRDKAEQFLANLEFTEEGLSSYTTYTVTKRDKLDAIAPQFDISAEELRRLNSLPSGIVLRPGTTLVVPRRADVHGDIPADVAQNAKVLYDMERPMRRITLKARRGDTTMRIAKRYGVTAAQVRDWNALHGDRVAVGQRVVVYQPVRLAKARTIKVAHGHKHAARSGAHAKGVHTAHR